MKFISLISLWVIAFQIIACAQVPKDAMQWHIVSDTYPIQSEQGISLLNTKSSKFANFFVDRGSMTNISWEKQESTISLKRLEGFFDPIAYGDVLSLTADSLGTIKAQNVRTSENSEGLGQDCCSGPSFEWEIRGGKIGEPIDDKEVALYNLLTEAYLIHNDEGDDLTWESNKYTCDRNDLSGEDGVVEAMLYLEGPTLTDEMLFISLQNAKQIIVGGIPSGIKILHLAANSSKDLCNAVLEFDNIAEVTVLTALRMRPTPTIIYQTMN
jgi:hypothetical protein